MKTIIIKLGSILLITALVFLNLFLTSEVSLDTENNLNYLSKATAATHENAINKWCQYFPKVEGCCEHDTRVCTNQNFCDDRDCD